MSTTMTLTQLRTRTQYELAAKPQETLIRDVITINGQRLRLKQQE